MNLIGYSLKSMLIRCTVITIGVMAAALGCACYLFANLGSDPVTLFVQGLGLTLGISAGMATNLLNATAFILLLIANRKLIHIGTAIYTVLLGFLVDIFSRMLTAACGLDPSLALRIGLLVLGTLAIGVGLGLYQSAELGIGPTDGINQTIVAKTGMHYRWERMIFDAVMAGVGWLLGGKLSWGTIVGVVAVGPVMAQTLSLGKKMLAKLPAAAARDHKS